MSRIGRKPIAIPAGVEVSVDAANVVTVKGPKGTLSQKINPIISVSVEGNEIIVTRPNDEKENRARITEFFEALHAKYGDKIEIITATLDEFFTYLRENVKDIFKIKNEFKHKIKGKTVLLIDDIFTTGATASEICKLLTGAGASRCYVLTLAHTNFKDIEK